MERHLFITGPVGSDPGELLRTALGQELQRAGGFVSQTMRQPGGEALCRSLLPAAAAGGVEGFEAQAYLDLRAVPPMHDNEVLRTEGVRLLQEALCYPFAVVEPIGSFELLIPQSRKEAEALCRRLGLGQRVKLNIDRLWQALKADPDTLIADVSGLHRRRALAALSRWTEEYVR